MAALIGGGSWESVPRASVRPNPYVGIGLRLNSRLGVHELIPGGVSAACGLIEPGIFPSCRWAARNMKRISNWIPMFVHVNPLQCTISAQLMDMLQRITALFMCCTKTGDTLLVIDGINVVGKKPADVSHMIVGPLGSTIELVLLSKRLGSQIPVKLVRGSQAHASVGTKLMSYSPRKLEALLPAVYNRNCLRKYSSGH